MNSEIEQLILHRFQHELVDDSFHTTLMQDEHFDLLFIRFLDTSDENLIVKARCFVFIEDSVFEFSRERSHFLEVAGAEGGFVEIIKHILKKNRAILNHLVDIIEDLEEHIYERSIPTHFMDAWFKLRKNLSKVDRYYTRLNGVFMDLVDTKIGEENQLRYQKLMVSFDGEHARTDLLLKKLDGLYNYHELIRSDKLNRTVYLLTVISGIFLPLNFIVGLFGMNTTDLFFTTSPNGTTKVIFLLGLVLFSLTLGARLLKMIIDRLRIKRSVFRLGDFLSKL